MGKVIDITRRKYFFLPLPIVSLATTILLMGAQGALAHQKALFTIGNKDYLIVIGSQNEPVFVDDKSGVDLFVYTPDPKDPMNSVAKGVKPVEGLEKTIKVELLAGPKNKVLQLEPAFRDPGHYNAPFYPTIQTTYNYRILGNINNTPVNLTFNCSVGAEATTSNNSTVKISDGVTRKGVAGSFGCPESRSAVAFPEPYMSNVDIQNKLASSSAGNSTNTTTTTSVTK